MLALSSLRGVDPQHEYTADEGERGDEGAERRSTGAGAAATTKVKKTVAGAAERRAEKRNRAGTEGWERT